MKRSRRARSPRCRARQVAGASRTRWSATSCTKTSARALGCSSISGRARSSRGCTAQTSSPTSPSSRTTAFRPHRGAVNKAVHYARRAGERALRLLAHEEAVRLFHMALTALALERPADESVKCELLLSLGDAQMRSGDAPAAKESFRSAADLARRLALPHLLARAALGYGGRFVWAAARGDRLLVELLDAAARMLGDAPSALMVRVQARLATALRDAPAEGARRHALSAHALAVARQLGDAATLAYALEVRTVILCGPDDIDARLALAGEMLRLAAASGDRERVLEAHHWRLMAFWEQGDAVGLEVEVAAQTSVAEELRQPAQLWYSATTRAMQALFVGRFETSEALIARALELGTPAQGWNARQSFWLQTFALRRERGDLAGIEAHVRQLIDEHPEVAYWRSVLAVVCCEVGRTDEARAVLDGLARNGFEELPRDEDWLVAMTLLAEVCAHVGDQRRAAIMHGLLLPYATKVAITPPNLSTGAVARSLGLLAARDADGARPRSTSRARWTSTAGWALGRGWRARSTTMPRCCWPGLGPTTGRARRRSWPRRSPAVASWG